MFTVGIICGGPSPERGISLNSARSVLDHLKASQVDIRVFFVDPTLTFYEIPSEQLYSNTPSDFDFKLASVGTKLDESSLQPTLKACDMVFPVIHGAFGEDGQLASLLESFSIPFIGNASDTSLKAYEKDRAQQHLANHGKPTLPHFLIQKDNLNSKELVDFWTSYIPEKAILKPVRGGSSIDVYSLSDLKSLHVRAQDLLTRHKCIMLQPYYHGTELTITVLENAQGELVALPPTATRILQKEADIFSFRAKYLPSYATHNHTPAPLPRDTLLTISKSVSEIFRLFNLRDCARFDGWYDPEKGFICNDINPMSGLEESSFFFKQAASCGLSHAQVLSLLLKRACSRHQISPPKFTQHTVETDSRQTIPVLFGGASTERQVSVMSGRNVWLKLMHSKSFKPVAYFLDQNKQVWELPYTLALHHTVEEIEADLTYYQKIASETKNFICEIGSKLGALSTYKPFQKSLTPQSLESFTQTCVHRNIPFVFLALHGGIGEDGTIQKMLEDAGIAYNGSHKEASYICMNKFATRNRLREAKTEGLYNPMQFVWHTQRLDQHNEHNYETLWSEICMETQHNGPFIVKPVRDGCSSGIVRLNEAKDLQQYASMLYQKISPIPPHTFHDQPQPVEIDLQVDQLLIEPYIITDKIQISDQQLQYEHQTGWIELTMVVTEKNGHYHALTPSITVSESAVLSVEEKFQGGTGINLTPPPEQLVDHIDVQYIQNVILAACKSIGINQYARIDLFFNTSTKEVLIIEANSLPALTPSTVLFQQALCEKPGIKPLGFLEKLIKERMPEASLEAS